MHVAAGLVGGTCRLVYSNWLIDSNLEPFFQDLVDERIVCRGLFVHCYGCTEAFEPHTVAPPMVGIDLKYTGFPDSCDSCQTFEADTSIGNLRSAL